MPSLIMHGFCTSNALYLASLSFRVFFFFWVFLIVKIVVISYLISAWRESNANQESM